MIHGSRKWIKLWVDPWLSSTMRFTLDHKQRAVWADLLALGGQSRISGTICAGEEGGKLVGFPLSRVAGAVDVPDLKELSGILDLFEKQQRITVETENGRIIIRLLNWSKYQSEYVKQKKYKDKKKKQEATQNGKGKEALPDKLSGQLPESYPEGYRVGYPKVTSTEVEEEGEEVQNHCANPPGSHDSDSLLPAAALAGEQLNAVLRVWAYYLEKFGKNPKVLSFTATRRKRGLARLRECLHKTCGDLMNAEALMFVAVDNLAASEFHRGKNEQNKKYDSWEDNLFPSQDKFEKWLDQE